MAAGSCSCGARSRVLGNEVPAPSRAHPHGRPLREKASIRTIAAELGRSPSMISREIRRDGMPLRGDHTPWVYRPHAAQRRARPAPALAQARLDRPEHRAAER
ncbi:MULTISPECIES: helix-turn-helix domain-containing protein [unclassified Streptomyces]|uniref:helix-turn-helix domain-containing protein n=1 Tax=unclassified Streptomyces TaxID=2593676 RepID=UPI00386994D3